MTQIVIKRADKGGAVVILNTVDYEEEVWRQLNNVGYYQVLLEDPTEALQMQIQAVMTEAFESIFLTDKEKSFLNPLYPKIPAFYILPKIHKSM